MSIVNAAPEVVELGVEDGRNIHAPVIPKWSFHPGVILVEDYMKPLGMDIMGLSKALKLPIKVLKPITKCKAPITPEVAKELARHFDTTDMFWLNLQKRWDAVVNLKLAMESKAPKYYMCSNGYTPPSNNWVSKNGFVKI